MFTEHYQNTSHIVTAETVYKKIILKSSKLTSLSVVGRKTFTLQEFLAYLLQVCCCFEFGVDPLNHLFV